MLISVKTLDQKIFRYTLDEDDCVDDLKALIEAELGEENIYKLIYRGEILDDDLTLKSYNFDEKYFVILMITEPNTKSSKVKIFCSQEEENVDASIETDCDVFDDFDDEKQGLEWIEEQIRINAEKHFVTDKDFLIALEVVMDMEYLADIGNNLKVAWTDQTFSFINRDSTFRTKKRSCASFNIISRTNLFLMISRMSSLIIWRIS